MELNVEKRERKHPQTIWLKTSIFSKILELSSQLGVAPNVVCSMIIEKYLSNCEPIQKVTVKEKEIVIECPFCYRRFNDLHELRVHLKEHVSEIMMVGDEDV